MIRKLIFKGVSIVFVLVGLLLSGCSTLITPVNLPKDPPTPVVATVASDTLTYQNDAYGFNVVLPRDTQVFEPDEKNIDFIGPQGTEGHPGGAYLSIEPANGRSAEQAARQAADEAKAMLGAGNTVTLSQAMDINGVQGFEVRGMPGQDPNRVLFIVHGDRLYRILFMPDSPESGGPYRQMEAIYQRVLKTLWFMK